MSELRIIKKYPNRRLYDTTISQYITLDSVKELILKHIPFKVIDARTEEDMTNNVLLQIINEQEAGQSPLFTKEILLNIIRFYGNPMQKMLSQMLEKSFAIFDSKESSLNEHVENFIKKSNDPLAAMSQVTQQNLAMWQSMVNQYFQQVNPNPSTPNDDDNSKGKKRSNSKK